MSFVVVLPVAPVIATTRALERSRTSPAIVASARLGWSGTSVAAAPRASACRTKSAPASPAATNRSPSSIRRESICTPVTSLAHGCACSAAERLDQLQLERDHRRGGDPLQGLARDVAVVERDLPGGELLLGLGAAAGDHDDVARARVAERELDRGAAVELDLEPAERARGDLGRDRGRILAARVVGGEDRAVGELGDDAAHQRPLRAVAVAAGAEHDDEPRLVAERRARRGCTLSSESGVCA